MKDEILNALALLLILAWLAYILGDVICLNIQIG